MSDQDPSPVIRAIGGARKTLTAVHRVMGLAAGWWTDPRFIG